METILIIAGYIFIVLAFASIGFTFAFMYQVDVFGSNQRRDL